MTVSVLGYQEVTNGKKNSSVVPPCKGGNMTRTRRTAVRKNLGGGLSCFISDALVQSPSFRSLSSMTSIGIYFILMVKSDAYGCIEAYEGSNAMMSHTLGGHTADVTLAQFCRAIQEIHDAGLIRSLMWRKKYVWLLPFKLPQVALSYYPTPRILPATIVSEQIKRCAPSDPYLDSLVASFNFSRLENEFEEPEIRDHEVIEDYPIAFLKRKEKRIRVKKEPDEVTIEQIKGKKIELPPEEQEKAKHIYSDMRVAALQSYIDDNFDIELTGDQLLSLVLKYGTDYASEMVTTYGAWRLNNPPKARKHKNHNLAMNSKWVHDKVLSKMLPNPNDELIKLRWNVYVTKLELPALKKHIKALLDIKDEHDVDEWLRVFSEKVSADKARQGMVSTDVDANLILAKIENQAKYSKGARYGESGNHKPSGY